MPTLMGAGEDAREGSEALAEATVNRIVVIPIW